MTSTVAPQFGVVAQVEIVPPFTDGVKVNPDITPGVTQSRIDWRVVKGVGGSQPSDATALMFNLAKSSRSKVAGVTKRIVDFSDEFAFLDGRLVEGQDLGGSVTVNAGTGFGTLKISARYSGSSATAAIFDGTMNFGRSQRVNGHTWVTRAQGSDGVIQQTSAIADRAWVGDVTATEVLDYLIGRVMVAQRATPLPPELLGYVFSGGYDATNYYATDILDQLTDLTQTEWWWDDGEVFFSSLGQPLPGPAIVVSANGEPGTRLLIDKPERIEGNKVNATMLLAPDVRPKSLLTIRSSELGGQYFVSSIEHRGQNRGSRSVSRTVATCTPVGVVGFI